MRINTQNRKALVLQIPYYRRCLGTQNLLQNNLQKGAVSN